MVVQVEWLRQCIRQGTRVDETSFLLAKVNPGDGHADTASSDPDVVLVDDPALRISADDVSAMDAEVDAAMGGSSDSESDDEEEADDLGGQGAAAGFDIADVRGGLICLWCGISSSTATRNVRCDISLHHQLPPLPPAQRTRHLSMCFPTTSPPLFPAALRRRPSCLTLRASFCPALRCRRFSGNATPPCRPGP